MLEKLLKKLGEKGYEISWRYCAELNCIDIRLEKEGHKLNRKVTFSEMRYISGGLPGFEFGMTQILRLAADKIEEELKGENEK